MSYYDKLDSALVLKACLKYVNEADIENFLNDIKFSFTEIGYDEDIENLILASSNKYLIELYLNETFINCNECDDFYLDSESINKYSPFALSKIVTDILLKQKHIDILSIENLLDSGWIDNNISLSEQIKTKIIKQAENNYSLVEEILDSKLIEWTTYHNVFEVGYVHFEDKVVSKNSFLSQDEVLKLFNIYAEENHWYKNIDVNLFVEDSIGLKNYLDDTLYNQYTLRDLVEDYYIPIDYFNDWGGLDYNEDGILDYNMRFTNSEAAEICLDNIYIHL